MLVSSRHGPICLLGRMTCYVSIALAMLAGCGAPSPSPARGVACEQDKACSALGDTAYCRWSDKALCGTSDKTGLCSTKPSLCPPELDRVCGCDGLTYDNACLAAQQGVSVARRGACALGAPGQEGRPCADLSEGRCELGLFCSYLPETQCGHLSKRGVCQRIPKACSGSAEPVCGCDGRTYASLCLATMAGVSISRTGDCSTLPGAAKSPCGSSPPMPCDPGLYCKYELGSFCGVDGETGICEPRSTQCSDEYAPVCGCDGRTHLNPCRADRIGVSIEHAGHCKNPQNSEILCDGSGDFNCSADQYCDYAPETKCGQTQAQGVCKFRRDYCRDMDADDDVDEDEDEETLGDDAQKSTSDRARVSRLGASMVCGCDNVSYASACFAAIRGISIAHHGACPNANPISELGEACTDVPPVIHCADGLFCSTTHRRRCSLKMTLGRCEARPQECPSEGDPVCGCDGKDYANACLATKAGVSIDYPLPCDMLDPEDSDSHHHACSGPTVKPQR